MNASPARMADAFCALTRDGMSRPRYPLRQPAGHGVDDAPSDCPQASFCLRSASIFRINFPRLT